MTFSLIAGCIMAGRVNWSRISSRDRMQRQGVEDGKRIIEPCLPSPAKAPPSGSGWLREIKHDGFRTLARRDAAGVRLIILSLIGKGTHLEPNRKLALHRLCYKRPARTANMANVD